MNIFEKRPLCLILCIGLCGFLFFTFDNDILRVSIPVISILLIIISLFLKRTNKNRNIILLSSIAVLTACICSFLFFDLHFKAYKKYDEEIEVVGIVENVTQSSSYSNRILVKVENINGKNLRSYRFYAYPTKTESKGIIEGTKISFRCTLDGFSKESFTYNVSKGINAYASDIADIQIIEYSNGTITQRISRIREYLTRYIVNLSDAETGAILSALLLGERDYLPDQLRLDFKRIGISHILALSGMHLAILSTGIGKILSLLGVKKKLRLSIISIFVILYMALTGFSVSVVRAGLMLLISTVLFLLSRSKDSLTSLSLAVLIICIISPNAIMDISLWLSALATFGIIAFSEWTSSFESSKDKKKKIVYYLASAIMVSVFAISSTLAVSTSSFGGFSILAPITTIIFSFLSEIIMYLGCIMAIVGWIIPIGWIIKPFCRILTFLAGAFSSLKISYVSSNFPLVMILILIYTFAFYLFLIIKLKNPKRCLNILVIFYVIISFLPSIATLQKSNSETVAYYSDYKCDEILVRSENEVCLINSAQYSKDLAYTSLDFLEAENVTYLDKYYLTHYSWSIDDEIETLMYNVLVKEIYIPEPRNEDEETILKILYKSVENSRTKIVVFREYETVYVGDYSINLLYSEPYGNTSVNAFAVAKSNEVYTYISSGLLATKFNDRLEKYISLTDHLILGKHGKKYKERLYIENCYPDLDTIVINSDNVFLKQNNMQYYLDKNTGVYSHPENIIYFVK